MVGSYTNINMRLKNTQSQVSDQDLSHKKREREVGVWEPEAELQNLNITTRVWKLNLNSLEKKKNQTSRSTPKGYTSIVNTNI